MRFDDSQRRAIDCEANVVVTAGAGSGKTTVLAERFVRLIREQKAAVDEILTLTFTRKAAAEMHDRIYRRLLTEEDLPSIREALARFETAQISTLDSFCSRIVRNDAGRFGITPDFSVSEDDALETVEETALRFVLDHHDHPGVRALIAQNGMSRTITDGLVPLGMDYFTLARAKDLEAMRDRQAEVLDTELNRSLAEIRSIAAVILELPPSTKSLENAHAAAASVESFDELLESGEYARLAELLSSLGKLRKPGSNSKREELVQLAEVLDELKERAAEAAEIALSVLLHDRAAEAFDALSLYQEEARRAKRAGGRITFQDVVDMAVASLSENAELRSHYKRRFRYIMIDEFQDNNELQKELLFLLAEREDRVESGVAPATELESHKLYFVGDEKQSIYRFRGADVRVFKSLAAELAESGGTSLQLTRNYRSHPQLVGFFNRLFERLLGAPSEDKQDFEADFSMLEAGPGTPDAPAHIDFLYKPYRQDAPPESLANDEAEAYAVASYIQTAVSTGALIHGDDVRPVQYDDFAILLRSATNQATFERMLRHFGIPYNAGTVRSLFLEAPVNDMYNLLQLVVYPSDRLAYASLLRSPLVSLSDEAIVRILRAQAPPFKTEPSIRLSDEDAAKLTRGAQLYREIGDQADRVPPARLVSKIWYDWGYRYILLSDPRFHSYLEHYDYFHELALQYTGRPLVAFLDAIRPLLGSYERIPDLEVLGRDETGVQILTIHKSKGLEFPVVIVANMGNVGRPDDGGSTPIYRSEEFGITFNLSPPESRSRANYFYRRGKEENDARELAEIKRVLYVAATRAESHLVFSGFHHYGNRSRREAMLNLLIESLGLDIDSLDDDQSNAGRAAGELTIQRIDDQPRNVLRGSRTAGSRRSRDEAIETLISAPVVRRQSRRTELAVTEVHAAAATDGAPADGAAQTTATVGQLDDPEQKLPSDRLVEEIGAQAFFGTLSHRVVEEYLRTGSPPRESEVRWPSSIPEEHRARLLSDAAELSRRFLESRWWREFQAEQVGIESEVEVLLRCPVDGVDCFLRGVIDVLASTTSKTTVVDFKTDRILNPAGYALQLSLYAEAAAGLIDSESAAVRVVLVHLRSGEPIDVTPLPSALDQAASAIRSIWEDES